MHCNLALIADQNKLFYFLRGSSCYSTRHPQPSSSPSRYLFFCPFTLSFRRICYPPALSMRIYYPINYEEPTPALPKGGSLNEAQYSLTSNRLTSNGHYPPSLGERLRVGELCSGNRRSRFACRRMGLGVGPRLRRITYPPEQIPLLSPFLCLNFPNHP